MRALCSLEIQDRSHIEADGCHGNDHSLHADTKTKTCERRAKAGNPRFEKSDWIKSWEHRSAT